MKMTHKPLWTAIPLYLIAAVCAAACLIAELHPRLSVSPAGRVALLSVFCLCVFSGSRCLCLLPELSPERIMRRTFSLFFFLYLWLLFTFTLFDPAFGRNTSLRFIWEDSTLLRRYLETSFNPVPFSTIRRFLLAFRTGALDNASIAVNLLGNLAALMPLGLFLPLLFPRFRRFFPFLLVAVLVVLAIELLQLLLVTGFCDIDDLILNVSGACLAYSVFRLKPVVRLISTLTLLQITG